MTMLAVEKIASIGVADELSYDQNKWNLPNLMKLRKDIGTPFVGPCIGGVARPVEQSAAIPGIYPWALQWADKKGLYITGTVEASGQVVTGNGTSWKTAGVPVGARIGFYTNDRDAVISWFNISSITSDTVIGLSTTAGTVAGGSSYVIDMNLQKDWVFLADNASAGTTRRVQLYEYNRMTSVFGWVGFVTLTPPSTGNHTIKGFRMTYDLYTTGTVAVSGATVTGTGTAWLTGIPKAHSGNANAGCRIGFGSTDPTQISTWYHINAISADGTMTIVNNASGTLVASNLTISSGTSYVIEDLRAIFVTTNSVASQGGLFVAKGLSRDKFTSGGVTILGTATTGTPDNMCNVYWLGDVTTNTNNAGVGLAMESKTSWTSQLVYVADSTGGVKIYKYNIRGALSITTLGMTAIYKDISQFVLATGSQAVTGTLSATNNSRFARVSHGPLNGVDAVYFVTTTRIYGLATSVITAGSTTFLTYTMTEVPPGGVATFTATGAMACIEYASTIDRFIIISSGAAGVRSYVSQFRTDAGQIDNIFLCDDKQIDQAGADANSTPHPSILVVTQTPWVEGGILYLAGVGTTAATNIVHAVPIGADWLYTGVTSQRAISPRLLTPNCAKFKRVYFVRDRIIGGDNIGKPADPVKLYYRTAGISDNTGGWTAVPEPNDLSGVTANSEIQFAWEFKCISDFCVPSRIFLVGVVYEDLSTDSHFQPSANLSLASTKQFAWRLATAFGTAVPTLRLRLYNAETGALLLDDDTVTSAYGTFMKTIDSGSNWITYNTTDKANENTYIRYIPSSLGDNIKVTALLTLN